MRRREDPKLRRIVQADPTLRKLFGRPEPGEPGYWECENGIPFCRHCDICGYPSPCGRDHE